MKTKNRVLLSAGMLFALTGVTLGASTYAWFTGSRTQSLTMGNVSVSLPQNLTVDSPTATLGRLTDVSSPDGQNFYKGVFNSANDAFTSVSQISSTGNTTEVSGFFEVSTFTFTYNVDATIYGAPSLRWTGITITEPTAAATPNSLKNSLRLAIYAGTTLTGIYNELASDVNAVQSTSETNPAGTAIPSAVTRYNSTNNFIQSPVALGNMTAGTVSDNLTEYTTTLTVVTWIEGTAASCTTTAVGPTATASIAMSFDVVDTVRQ